MAYSIVKDYYFRNENCLRFDMESENYLDEND